MDNSILNSNSLRAAIMAGDIASIGRLLSFELTTNIPFITINKLKTGTVRFMILNTSKTLGFIIANEQNFSDADLNFYADNYLIHALIDGIIVMNGNDAITDIDDLMIDEDTGMQYHDFIVCSDSINEYANEVISQFYDGGIINHVRALKIFLLPFFTIVSNLLGSEKVAECLNTLVMKLPDVNILIPLAESICHLFGSHKKMLISLMEDNCDLDEGDRVRAALNKLFVRSGIISDALWNQITQEIPLGFDDALSE